MLETVVAAWAQCVDPGNRLVVFQLGRGGCTDSCMMRGPLRVQGSVATVYALILARSASHPRVRGCASYEVL